jgi:hypothetical protein
VDLGSSRADEPGKLVARLGRRLLRNVLERQGEVAGLLPEEIEIVVRHEDRLPRALGGF